MDTIIRELIAYDRQAKAVIEEAVLAKQKMEQELPEEEKHIYDEVVKRANDRVDRIEKYVQSDHQDDVSHMQQRYQMALKELESRYEANHERWSREIFERCIARED